MMKKKTKKEKDVFVINGDRYKYPESRERYVIATNIKHNYNVLLDKKHLVVYHDYDKILSEIYGFIINETFMFITSEDKEPLLGKRYDFAFGKHDEELFESFLQEIKENQKK